MLRIMRATLGAAAFLLAVGTAHAADVKVTGLHQCCGNCTKTITTALEKSGATNIKVEKGEATFAIDDAQKAADALFEAGFIGKAEGVRPPRSGARGVKGKEIKIEGVHNCCGSCTAAINKSLTGINTGTVKPKETSFTVTSADEIEASKVVTALRGAGFNAKVGK